LMSVNPGFGGQKFISTSVPKLRRLKQMIDSRGLETKIEIDGGIDENNISSIVESGADIVVAGSAVFGNGDAEASVRNLITRGSVFV
jgi:ribulose-phosphate 3-epimerase